MECTSIHYVLQKLLVNKAQKLPEYDLNALKKKCAQKNLGTNINVEVRWKLLSGKAASHETRLLLSQAVAIFHVSTGHIARGGSFEFNT